MSLLNVNKENCLKCGICVECCPSLSSGPPAREFIECKYSTLLEMLHLRGGLSVLYLNNGR